jgi:hypothetical protein
MRIEIEHRLSFSLLPGTAQVVSHLLLTPGMGTTQQLDSWSVEAPGIGNAGRFVDAFGNHVHLVNQSRPEAAIEVVARGVVITQDSNGVIGHPSGEPVPALYRRITEATKAPAEFLAGFTPRPNRLETLHALMRQVGETLGLAEGPSQSQMQADGAQEQAQQGADAVSASNHAHLFIAAARALDIPARYVSGYLVGGEDHSGGLHAWAEAFDPGLGWIGFDPVLQLCSTERHVRLAVGLDAQSAVALRTVPVVDIAQDAVVRAG